MNKKITEVQLGIAPINWTNDDMPDLGSENSFEQCISEMALARYTGCEVGTKFPVDNPNLLSHMLKIRNLRICNQWHSLFLCSKSLKENIQLLKKKCEFLKFMGCTVIGVSEQTESIQSEIDVPLFNKQKKFLDKSEWTLLCRGINEIGKIVKEEYGIVLTYHYHLGTAIETQEETDRLLENTDERYVNLLYDTGHIFACGGDALHMIKKYKTRVRHVHLKDVRTKVLKETHKNNLSFLNSVRRGLFTIPSDGDINFEVIFNELFNKNYSYKGWLVVEAEQDPQKANAYEYALKARTYIQDTLGI